jgi:hypothetical protein
MTYYLVKILLTAGLVVAVSELSKRSSLLGGLLASLPLVSFLAMIWLFYETGDTGKVAALSRSIFWLVLPSLTLFLTLPWLLQTSLPFAASLGLATLLMLASYGVLLLVLRALGIPL